ncbi:hypothetical protein PAECIP112173_03172 [Paenibacillus sp. JJ-100]|uniref:glycosyltransferase n=1 Tax=Paenibacillus sp. JJ-100 TaxID=2974896 RepID=UPI0022FF7CFB|nr:TPR domain-containing glycosyltransferase [Paenibacillus sp. JJ-100]CAI6081294.1 hypothetical protein PAECIP112173_03172 [Paenibacillus sp. JJ-100]
MKHQTISLCMIVKDEERTLERCLNSVKGIVDEIIIIDTGSTDNTVDICKKFTTKIFNFEWNSNFSDARNYAMKHATSDYILSLDADEYLTEPSKRLLLEPLSSGYYFLRIRNMVRSGIVDTHSFVRLFRRDVGYVYEGAIHEQINYTQFTEIQGSDLPVYINHDGYNKAIIQSKDKLNRNMKIIEEELKINPTGFGYFNLGTQYKALGKMESAIEAFKKSYSLSPQTSYAPKMMLFLMQCLYNLKRYDEALKVAKDAVLLYPEYTDLVFDIGVIYKEMNYWKDAEEYFLKCLEIGEVTNYLYSSLEGVGSYLAHANLAEIYIQLDQPELAHQHIITSLTQNKVHLASLRIFLELFINATSDDLLQQLKGIYTLDSAEEVKLLMQVIYHLRHPLFTILAQYIRQDIGDELKAWISQMKGDFQIAQKLWAECGEITNGSQRDLLLVAIVNEDLTFFKQFDHEFNLRSKDKSIFIQMINRETITNMDLSKDIKKYIEDLCYDVLMQRRYDVVEYLMTKVQVPMIRYQLAKMLFKFEFYELALECIMEPEKSTDKNQVYLLVGDILKKLEMYGDAYQYYSQVRSNENNFEVLYKIYDLAVLVEDKATQEKYIKAMSNITPISEWIIKLKSPQTSL